MIRSLRISGNGRFRENGRSLCFLPEIGELEISWRLSAGFVVGGFMRILGLDYGSKTVGVAVSDELGITAQGLETISRKSEGKLRQTCARLEELIQELNGLNDSKQLTEKTRKALFPKILENTFYSIQPIDEDMIDKINILNATCEAMRRACMDVVGQIRTTCIVLADGNNKIRGYEFPQKTVIKGDAKSASIAAASILAKVSRDEFMMKLDKEFPMYGWKHNKGYLSKEHMDAIVNTALASITEILF